MPRPRTGIIVIAVLLAASGLAFLRAEQLKLERSPVGGTKLQKYFSTTCPIHRKTRCTSHAALLRFRLRKPATVALAIVNGSGDIVRRLTPAAGERLPRGPVKLRWNGRTDAQAAAPQGTYHLRVDLRSLGRVITIPDPIELDNTLPTLTLLGRRGELPLRYRTSEPAVVYVIARAAGRAALYRGRGGRVHFRHTRLSGSEAQITLVAVDRAGNRSTAVAAGSFHLPA
ncbi:MAG TPA: FlgD immunoglobulin-like domain containing protein [Gaiellales bacterium]